jgi:leucyl/phenylalanyl-tRNA---protein transferase
MSGFQARAPWDVPPSRWPHDDLIGLDSSFDPARVIAAYRHGVFPMPIDGGPIGWWSPVRRGVLPIDRLRVTRSMRQSAKHFYTTVDAAFDDVVLACADPRRPGGWIDDRVFAVYRRLHRFGVARSVEVWRDGLLAGGLYGVAINGLFAGESMFSLRRDASKVALMTLVDLLDDDVSGRLLDVQWSTPHLASLGVVEVSREDYLRWLAEALELPLPTAFLHASVVSRPRAHPG